MRKVSTSRVARNPVKTVCTYQSVCMYCVVRNSSSRNAIINCCDGVTDAAPKVSQLYACRSANIIKLS